TAGVVAAVLVALGFYLIASWLTQEPPNSSIPHWLRWEPPNYSRIEDGLYLGGSVPEPPPDTQAVLNLCEMPDPYQAAVHRWEPIPDAEPAPGLDWLRRQVEFIEDQRGAGRTIYVHCRSGVSRGGLVVVAYLMAQHGWSRDQALAFVRISRPMVRPNPGFMSRLQEWERSLK
ncbi:MAG: dual specificity protein phosphatase family protein, partial [Planctomycetes bacterium]|nr:dual specificity protein phosphatase family protein [Planctomycetota bacterium]